MADHVRIVVLICALFVSAASFAATPPKQCAEVLSGATLVESGKSVIEESSEFRNLLQLVSEGKASLEPTPNNRQVSFKVISGKGGSVYEGRIKETRVGASGEIEIVFLRKYWPENREEIILFSKIDIESATVTKILTDAQIRAIAAKFEEAIQPGAAVKYIDQFSAPTEVQGRITRLIKNRNGKIDKFVLAEDNGLENESSIQHVDPSSIVLFAFHPRALSKSEATLVINLKSASESGRYVSFRINSLYDSSLFEGWVTGVEVGTDGEYMFRLNAIRNETGQGDHKYRLSNILAESFNPNPILSGRGVMSLGKGASTVDGVIASKGRVRSVTISPQLYSELSVFADPQQVSGSKLPEEIERLVQPGQEMRLYFECGERRVRLTVRRHINGSWSFGDTVLDRLAVDENFRDKYADGSQDPRYAANERDRLEAEIFKERLPAARLRGHMRLIRHAILREAVMAHLGPIFEQWSKSFYEHNGNDEVLELMLHEQGQKYYLDSGFVAEATAPLAEPEAKKLAAIRYLMQHNMEFWSYNAGASHIKMGIYPRTGPGSVARPRRFYLTPIYFGKQLFESMENAGLEYVDGQWVFKKN